MTAASKRKLAGAVLALALLGGGVEAWRLGAAHAANGLIAAQLNGEDRPVGAAESQNAPVLLARALYLARHGRSEDAQELLERLDGLGDAQAKARASYNLGGMRLRAALEKIDGGQLEQAIPQLALAKQAYRRALLWAPDYWDAKFNDEIALRLLPEMDQISRGDEPETEDARPKALWTKVPGFPRGQP